MHGRKTPRCGQLEGNHQFLFSNEDFFLLLLYSISRNVCFVEVFHVPSFFNIEETSTVSYVGRPVWMF